MHHSRVALLGVPITYLLIPGLEPFVLEMSINLLLAARPNEVYPNGGVIVLALE
jgi:hypothetical protein